MTKIGKAARIDTVGAAAANKKQLPFRWWVGVSLNEDNIQATVHYSTGRGVPEDPHKKSAVVNRHGESTFYFNTREVMDVIPAHIWDNEFALCSALRQVAQKRDLLNAMLEQRANSIAQGSRDNYSADSELLQAFSLFKSDGSEKPADDPIVSSLRVVALHEALIAKVNHDYVGFDIPRY